MNTVFNGLMVVVWVAYLTLFLREVKSHFRARLFIQLHGGYDLSAVCRLINMSDKPISIACVQVYFQYEDASWACEVTGGEMAPESDGAHSIPGALQSAESADLGTFRSLLEAAVGKQTPPGDALDESLLERLQWFEVRLVVQHGASDHPGAVYRSFTVERQPHRWTVMPGGSTRLEYSRRGRRLAQEWMRADADLQCSGSAA